MATEIENRWNCDKRIWAKFTEDQKVVYNNIRSYNQDIVAHPKTKLPEDQWNTMSHNFACLAAWEHKGVHSVIKEQKKG